MEIHRAAEERKGLLLKDSPPAFFQLQPHPTLYQNMYPFPASFFPSVSSGTGGLPAYSGVSPKGPS